MARVPRLGGLSAIAIGDRGAPVARVVSELDEVVDASGVAGRHPARPREPIERVLRERAPLRAGRRIGGGQVAGLIVLEGAWLLTGPTADMRVMRPRM